MTDYMENSYFEDDYMFQRNEDYSEMRGRCCFPEGYDSYDDEETDISGYYSD